MAVIFSATSNRARTSFRSSRGGASGVDTLGSRLPANT
jgi:hypothetical protein